MKLHISNTFTKELPADSIKENTRRQVFEACFSFVEPKKTKKPELIHASEQVASLLGIEITELKEIDFLNVFTGNKLLPDTIPYAICYGGHQFGNWAGQLGDGRAINLTEITFDSKRWSLQLKGAGPTPYSRTADGLAVLRSSVREYLCSEAMFHLGVPTTRALSLALSGDEVMRDVLYDGHPAYEKGAIVCRVAPSFLRFGNYEIHASRKEHDTLKILVAYTVKHFYPSIEQNTKEGYVQFFAEVAKRTLDMIIHWQRVGFVHGVMNTDNLSILGLTIDYGPYGWLEGFDKGWTPNTTDAQGKRYRFGNQIQIGLWNLYQLANALYPLVEEAKPLEAILDKYKADFEVKSLQMMRSKLGLVEGKEDHKKLISQLEEVLELTETDMTIFFRNLSQLNKEDDSWTAFKKIQVAFYKVEEVKGAVLDSWNVWLTNYINCFSQEEQLDKDRSVQMNKVNPKYVLRNYISQLAIDAADKGDFSLVDEIYQLLLNPYDEQPENEKWFAKRPEWARNKVGCSMLSCSS
tara:strand:+ start:1848 stop:3413 length:1566 start_codon:yes stop_codon:yes gene_type:complete